jgi:NitT/TauT family transport system permease protein
VRLINRHPDAVSRLLLPAVPFVLLVAWYFAASSARLAVNPSDKLLPGLATLADAVRRVALTPDPRTGQIILWRDTAASLTRLGAGLGISAAASFVLAVVIGMLPLARSLLARVVEVISLVPPLAVLPILFITVGLGEAAKVVLIVIGTAPFLVRDLAARVEELPHEQIVKAQSLGASSWQLAIRVVVPQLLPRLIDSVRLALGPAWLFLISAEAIASESGLGYRIFLVRRYFAMDVILPYVAWITLLAFALDLALRLLRTALFPWFRPGRRA